MVMAVVSRHGTISAGSSFCDDVDDLNKKLFSALSYIASFTSSTDLPAQSSSRPLPFLGHTSKTTYLVLVSVQSVKMKCDKFWDL